VNPANVGVDEPGGGRTERTFVFIDLAGFTALTAAHGDEEAVKLIDQFEGIVRLALSADGEFVKSVGDEAMLAFREIGSALESARATFERCVGASGFPLPRGGAFCGAAVRRSGDYVGGSVNTAARIAALSRSGQFLVGDNVAEVARARGMPVTQMGDFILRNLPDPVPIFEVDLVPSARFVIDPVCRMRVDQEDAIGVRHDGIDYWMCSLACAERFLEAPRNYVQRESL
jgi:class 3 adenylate cyclase/YHS domain-containing protein